MHGKSPDHNKKQNLWRKIAQTQEVTSRKTCNKQKSEKWGFRSKKSNKQCSKPLQKIRQQQNCTWNAKNWSAEQMKQQNIAHGTSNNTPQNAVIFTITKTAPPICRFLGQKCINQYKTKGKLQLKTFINKSNARNSASIHENASKLRMQARSEPGQRCKHWENPEPKFCEIF